MFSRFRVVSCVYSGVLAAKLRRVTLRQAGGVFEFEDSIRRSKAPVFNGFKDILTTAKVRDVRASLDPHHNVPITYVTRRSFR